MIYDAIFLHEDDNFDRSVIENFIFQYVRRTNVFRRTVNWRRLPVLKYESR